MGESRARAVKRTLLRQTRERMRDATPDDFGIVLDHNRYGRPRVRWVVPPEPVVRVWAIAELRQVLDGLERQAVLEMRADGNTWAEIGEMFGVSAQSVHARFRDLDNEFDAAATRSGS